MYSDVTRTLSRAYHRKVVQLEGCWAASDGPWWGQSKRRIAKTDVHIDLDVISEGPPSTH